MGIQTPQGQKVIALGYNADFSGKNNSPVTNEIVIGNSTKGKGSNTVKLGNSNTKELWLGNNKVYPASGGGGASSCKEATAGTSRINPLGIREVCAFDIVSHFGSCSSPYTFVKKVLKEDYFQVCIKEDRGTETCKTVKEYRDYYTCKYIKWVPEVLDIDNQNNCTDEYLKYTSVKSNAGRTFFCHDQNGNSDYRWRLFNRRAFDY